VLPSVANRPLSVKVNILVFGPVITFRYQLVMKSAIVPHFRLVIPGTGCWVALTRTPASSIKPTTIAKLKELLPLPLSGDLALNLTIRLMDVPFDPLTFIPAHVAVLKSFVSLLDRIGG
jgi:hypothetical protein